MFMLLNVELGCKTLDVTRSGEIVEFVEEAKERGECEIRVREWARHE